MGGGCYDEIPEGQETHYRDMERQCEKERYPNPIPTKSPDVVGTGLVYFSFGLHILVLCLFVVGELVILRGMQLGLAGPHPGDAAVRGIACSILMILGMASLWTSVREDYKYIRDKKS